MIYGYIRVSTKGQARNGNSLEVQEKSVKQCGATEIFSDSFSGKTVHRPAMDKLMAQLKAGDIMIVTKLDRIARSTTQGIELLTTMMNMGVTVNILNMGVMDNTPTGRLILTIFLAFAEFEREMIRERTIEGKEEKKEKLGDAYRDGRPRLVIPDFQKFFKKQKEGLITVYDAITILGISRATWYNLAKGQHEAIITE